jgi:hypothetical protein
MKSLTALLLLPALAFAAPTLDTRAGPQIQVSSIVASGPGCPQGSFSADINDDGTVITFGFDSYQTQVGSGVSGSEREKNCDIFLGLRYPLGCTSAVISTTYHGFAQLENGVSGGFPATYSLSPGSISGNPPETTFSSSQWSNGGVYTKQDSILTTATINSPSQQNVNFELRTRIRLNGANSNLAGVLTSDDATIAITQVKQC